MKRQSRFIVRMTAAVALAPAAAAYAHAGHGGGGAAGGLGHPLTGLDHLLAMLAVGIWGTQLGGRMIWALPLAFAGCMAVGGALALVPLPNTLVESMILASVVALGTLIMLALQTPPVLAISLVGGFALFHGYAHLAERGAGGSTFSYGLGVLAGTLLLHAAGVVIALSMRGAESGRRLVRIGGVFILACGVLLIAGAM